MMKNAFLSSLVLIVLFSVSGYAQSISEETPPISCGNRLVVGITCTGKYCDNITPICGGAIQDIYDIRWSGSVSEEGSAVANCNVPNRFSRGDWPAGEPAFITGFACRGDYCDNVALECVALRDAFPESYGGTSCRWTNWVSEERGGEAALPKRFLCHQDGVQGQILRRQALPHLSPTGSVEPAP